MALSPQAAWGFGIPDIAAYSILGFTSTDEVSDPYNTGGPHIKKTGNVGDANWSAPRDGAANSTYIWYAGWYMFEDELSNGEYHQVIRIYADEPADDDEFYLRVLGVAGAENLELTDSAAAQVEVGNTDIAINIWHRIVLRFGGNEIKGWVDGILEFTANKTAMPVALSVDAPGIGTSSVAGTPVARWWGWIQVTGSSTGDYDEVNNYTEVRPHLPVTGAPVWDEFGDAGNQGPTDTDGHYDDWDDWLTGVNDADTTLCAGNNRAGTTITSSSVDNPTVIECDAAHGLSDGDQCMIAGHGGSTPDINGEHTIALVDADTFTIPVNVTVGGAGGTVVGIKRQTSIMDDEAYTETLEFVVGLTMQRGTAAKACPCRFILIESTYPTVEEQSDEYNEGGGNHTIKAFVFDAAPGGAWTNVRLNDCEAGMYREGEGDGSNLLCTAIALEGVAIGKHGPGLVATFQPESPQPIHRPVEVVGY